MKLLFENNNSSSSIASQLLLDFPAAVVPSSPSSFDTKNHHHTCDSSSSSNASSLPNDYGYGYDEDEGVNHDVESPPHPPSTTRRTGRRSSLKTGSTDWTERRRASIGCTTTFCTCDDAPSSSPEQHTPRRRSITFKETALVCPVSPLVEKGGKHEDLWFQVHDFQRIKKKIHAIAKEIQNQGGANERQLCTRGIESFLSPDVKLSKTQRRHSLYDAIYQEQEHHYAITCETAADAEEGMSYASRVISRSSVSEARERARQDEASVQEYLQDTRRRRCSM
jgi:hypothetical protein